MNLRRTTSTTATPASPPARPIAIPPSTTNGPSNLSYRSNCQFIIHNSSFSLLHFPAAFTLIELMVVVTIIGILTALIIPEMKGTYQDALLRSASRDLINVFDLTYSRAVSLNQIRRVCLDEKNGRYLVEKRVLAEGQETFVPVDDTGCKGELNSKITMAFFRSNESPATDQDESPAGTSPSRREQPLVTGGHEDAGDNIATISFYPDGTADSGVVELTDRDGFRLALQINPITARVHVEELARK